MAPGLPSGEPRTREGPLKPEMIALIERCYDACHGRTGLPHGATRLDEGQARQALD